MGGGWVGVHLSLTFGGTHQHIRQHHLVCVPREKSGKSAHSLGAMLR